MTQGKMLATNIVYRTLNITVVFVITMLLSRLAGVAGYGLLSLLIANASLLNLLSAFGADAGLTFTVASGRLTSGKLIVFLGGILFLQIAAAMIVEAVSWYISGHLFLFKTGNLQYWWLGLVFLLAISLIEKYTALLNGKQLFTLCNKTVLISNLFILIVFTVLYFYIKEKSALFYITIYVLLNLVQAVFLIIAWHVAGNNPLSFEKPQKKDVTLFFSYSLFAFLINIIQFLAYRVDYWLLDYYKGVEELGWYSLAVRLAQLFWILPLLFASIIFPSVAGKTGHYDTTRMLALIRGMNWLNIVAGLVLFFIAPFLIPFLFGSDYQNSILLLQILLPGVLLFCMATIIAASFAGQQKLKINLYGSVLCLVTILVLDLLLIPSMGMKGAAIASSIGYGISALYFVIVYCFANKVAAVKLFIPQGNDLEYIRGILRPVSKK